MDLEPTHHLQAVVALQNDWAAQRDAGVSPPDETRPADQRLDRVWAAVGTRLQAVAELQQTIPRPNLLPGRADAG